MAPKKQDTLVGKRVFAPASLWPDYPPPKGQKGWEGKVGKKKDGRTHFVHFPGDAAKYFFEDREIEKWVIEEEGEDEAPAPAAKPAGKKAAPAPAAKPSGSAGRGAAAGAAAAAGGSRRREEEAAAPSSSKKAKVAPMNRKSMIELIINNLDEFDEAQVAAVHEAVLKVKLGR